MFDMGYDMSTKVQFGLLFQISIFSLFGFGFDLYLQLQSSIWLQNIRSWQISNEKINFSVLKTGYINPKPKTKLVTNWN